MFKKILFILFILVATTAVAPEVKAQCSMCTISAEQGTKNGNTQGKGLNSGILYLLAIPYLLITGIGILWYRNYRKKISSPALTTNN
ncbi:hypothetical protein FA045_06485 [Pedobacter cryotolerans]|uniref:Uncharacterized protein n=2 Tax=Pedobacter cryotolerans TaxID=2571270 RepID=A0A4U1C871_9SPHI|nr:hypothetical protein FA045_06485 [Pedobacter cryotolerans]